MTSPSYPAALDALANPGPTTETDDTGFELDIVVARLQNCVMAIEQKLGIGTSAPSTGTVLRATGAGATAFGAIQAADITGGAVGRPISETVLGAPAATITIPVPATPYKHLQLVLATFNGSANANIMMQLSADGTTYDATANYDFQWVNSTGTATTANEAYAQVSLYVGSHTPFGYAVGIVDLPAVAQSSVSRQYLARWFRKVDVIPGSLALGAAGGTWRSASQVRGIKLLAASGTFGAGSSVALYGLPV